MPTPLQERAVMTGSPQHDQETPREERPRKGWLLAVAPLWPLGLARILYGYLGWQEWGWTYTMLIMFPVLFLLTDAGRSFGVDAFLVPPLDRAAAGGSRLAQLIRWLV